MISQDKPSVEEWQKTAADAPATRPSPAPHVAQPYRVLVDRIAAAGQGEWTLRSVGVTSSQRGEGVSTVAANIAEGASAHSAFRSVLLVDAGIHRPCLEQKFQLESGPGLMDLLSGEATIDDAARRIDGSALWVLTTGTLAQPFSVAPDLRRLAETARQLETHFDLVVWDFPPVDEPGLTVPFCSMVGGFLLVIEAERTRLPQAERAIRTLAQSGANLLGVALNKERLG